MAEQKRIVRLIPIAKAGTITFAPKHEVVPDLWEHTGVTNVSYGVGVYFKIADNRASLLS